MIRRSFSDPRYGLSVALAAVQSLIPAVMRAHVLDAGCNSGLLYGTFQPQRLDAVERVNREAQDRADAERAELRSRAIWREAKPIGGTIHHCDYETFSAVRTSMFLDALVYAGQWVVNVQGPGDKDHFPEQRISSESMAKAAFQRAGFSSLFPLGVETIAGLSGFGPVFDFRSSDFARGAWRNPTWDLMQGVQRGARAIVAPIARDNSEFSQQDCRAITSALLF